MARCLLGPLRFDRNRNVLCRRCPFGKNTHNIYIYIKKMCNYNDHITESALYVYALRWNNSLIKFRKYHKLTRPSTSNKMRRQRTYFHYKYEKLIKTAGSALWLRICLKSLYARLSRTNCLSRGWWVSEIWFSYFTCAYLCGCQINRAD